MSTSGHTTTYEALITTQRYRESSRGRLSIAAETASDRSRIIFSSPFRRLQQKTQVFPLSRNAAVRSRLTHTLEVADVGRSIAHQIATQFLDLGEELSTSLVNLVDTACLMHDIGNPPFGHFAESVTRAWFRDNWERVMLDACPKFPRDAPEPRRLVADFVHFDGNPQGIRTVARLQGATAESRHAHGLNLLYCQVLTALKYDLGTVDLNFADLNAKAGYFLSEDTYVKRAREGLDRRKRHPLSYIVEAADDIAYSMSDIEDGVDHGLIDAQVFIDELRSKLTEIDESQLDQIKLATDAALDTLKPIRVSRTDQRDAFLRLKTVFTRTLIGRAADIYRERHDGILTGSRISLFEKESDAEAHLLESVKILAGKYLYSSAQVESPLRVGLSTIRGLLDTFKPILQLSRNDFDLVLDAQKSGDRKPVRSRGYDADLLIVGLLPGTYVEAYRRMRDDAPNEVDKLLWEWFCRAHLIVDYISGMADDFALRTFHSVSGVSYA